MWTMIVLTEFAEWLELSCTVVAAPCKPSVDSPVILLQAVGVVHPQEKCLGNSDDTWKVLILMRRS